MNKKLAQYSALSASFLFLGKAVAQVVYTDIEPDEVLSGDWVFAYIDMDNNGTHDFAFLDSSFSDYSYDLGGTALFQRIWCGANNPLLSSSIAGSTVTYHPRAYPYALHRHALISHGPFGDGMQFNNWGFQRMAFVTDNGFAFYGGNWYPEAINRYLGVRFLDSLGMRHYGWIRCTVKDEGRTLILKDYAYEIQPGNPIQAGDTTHYVVIPDALPINTDTQGTVYAFNKSIYIHLPQLPEPNTQVIVYDMLGRELYRQGIETTSTQIHLNTAAGIYLVTIQDKEGRYSKKVLVE